MPDTLGVTADEAAWNTSLVAGFAESQASLFDEEEPAIRTLDRIAEVEDAGAYRDLLHEIDRAFDGFARSAVRHGWLDAQGGDMAAPLPAWAESIIEPTTFVAEALQAETGSYPLSEDRLRLPAEWCAEIDGLPGFDRQDGTLRITRDRNRLRDEHGRQLAFLGRVHPVVRRACSHALRSTDDSRVAAAGSDHIAQPAILLTFSAAIRSAARLERQWLIAVLLPEDVDASVIIEPRDWLRYANKESVIPPANVWQTMFQHWVPARRPEAEAAASTAMHEVAERLLELNQKECHRENMELEAWLRRRADEICGPGIPIVQDLFGDAPSGSDWRFLSTPLDRLACFATDACNAAEHRREANAAVELFGQRSKEAADRAALPPPTLRPVGMLMLVPER